MICYICIELYQYFITMALAVIAYPVLDKKDYRFIQDFRKQHDPLLYSVIEPHFTFVFPVKGMLKDDFTQEILKQSEGGGCFDFTIRCAVVNKDSFLEYSHTLLVPDEGFSSIVKMHDKLYSDLLIKEQRLDIDYIPHVGIGTSKDILQCKQMADELNKSQLEIKGLIKELTIVEFENNRIENQSIIPLKYN